MLSKRVHGGGSIMVWGCFGMGGLRLEITEGRMDAEKYKTLLEQQLLPYVNDLGGEGYIFQQDNAPIHTSTATLQWLRANRINLLDWAALSPDLNLMENAWAMMVRSIYGGGKQYKSVNQLKNAILAYADVVDYVALQNLYNQVRDRLIEVVKLHGGPTNY